MWRAIFIISGVLWAQQFPDLNNQVAEIRVTELAQSGDRLKITVQNVSSRTIRGLSIVLGRRRVDPDWSALASGGLEPNATASVTISTAGLHAGGTRHHPAAGTLDVLGAVFTDGSPATTRAAEPPTSPDPTKRHIAEPTSAQAAGKPDALDLVPPPVKPATTTRASDLPAVAPPVRPMESPAAPKPTARPTAELPSAQVARKPDAPDLVPLPAKPVPSPDQTKRPATELPSAQVAGKQDVSNMVPPPAKQAPAVILAEGSPATTRAADLLTAAPTNRQAAEPPSPQVARKPDNLIPVPPPAKPVPIETARRAEPPGTPGIGHPSATQRALTVDVAGATGNPATVAPKVESAPVVVPPPPARERSRPPSEIGPEETNEAPKPEAKTPDAPALRAGLPGTHDQGNKDELAKLISLVSVYEPELASGFPRQTLLKMVAAVVKEQNELAAQPAVTPFDHGQRSALHTFAFGIQLIKDRRDLDDDTLRDQVARFLRNQRQTLSRR